jgi:hypothetical protein
MESYNFYLIKHLNYKFERSIKQMILVNVY